MPLFPAGAGHLECFHQLLGAHRRGDGALLLTLYCEPDAEGLLGAVVARRTTDRTIAAWRQLRAAAPAATRHLLPESPPLAPWVISKKMMLPTAGSCHAHHHHDPWLQNKVRAFAWAWLLCAP